MLITEHYNCLEIGDITQCMKWKSSESWSTLVNMFYFNTFIPSVAQGISNLIYQLHLKTIRYERYIAVESHIFNYQMKGAVEKLDGIETDLQKTN